MESGEEEENVNTMREKERMLEKIFRGKLRERLFVCSKVGKRPVQDERSDEVTLGYRK